MSKSRRSFSASEKLSIINEADQFGVTQTLRKHSFPLQYLDAGKRVLMKAESPIFNRIPGSVIQNWMRWRSRSGF